MGMRRWKPTAKWSAIVAVGFLLAACVGYLMGSVVLVDQGGQIVSASIVASDGASQPLYRLPGHMFAAIPRIEGEISIRCRDGSARSSGYVTPHLHVWTKIGSDDGCGRIAI